MSVRTIRLSLFFVLLGGQQSDISAATAKENIAHVFDITKQKIKDAGSYLGKIPEKFRDKVDRVVSDYWGNNPSLGKVAKVRAGLSLSPGEKKALAIRMEHSAAAIEKQFGKKSYTPKIAVLCSGGGYRAMFSTLGFLAGAQKTGLLDMVTWIAGVSGGAWGIGTVMAKAASENGLADIAQFSAQQAQLLGNKPIKPEGKAEYYAIGNILMMQSMGHQLFTTVNIFGAVLTNRIFGFLSPDARQKQLISQQSTLAKSGYWPIPIYTTVQYDLGLATADYRWVEFNPWEYGGTWLHSYAPIWATSRKFNDGVSTNIYPERSFGFILGICGSAFAAEFKDIYSSMKAGLYPFVRTLVEQSLLPRYATSRVTWGQLQNYSKGLSISPIKDETFLNLIDAGFTCNIPYQPLSGQRPERKPDILIIVDSSTTPVQSLRTVERYARKHNLKFPTIEYENIDKRFISVFSNHEDKEIPVVIYLWRISDQSLLKKVQEPAFKEYSAWIKEFDLVSCVENGPCAFNNFLYTQQTIMQLVKTIEFQTVVSMPTIFDVIQRVIDRKSESWLSKWKF